MEYKTKMAISIGLDVLDLALTGLGYILGAGFLGPVVANIKGILYDIVMGPVAIYLWGPIGAAVWAEVILPEEIDSFLPSLTIAGLISHRKVQEVTHQIDNVKQKITQCVGDACKK